MTLHNLNIDEALLLAYFDPHELAILSDTELAYLATIDDEEELPPADADEQFSPHEWKELFIRFVECYDEATTELASKSAGSSSPLDTLPLNKRHDASKGG